jgi:DNA-binding transcriptional regulator YhcF (GntR family)
MTHPAFNRALEYLTSRIEAHQWRPGELLPSIKQLAESAGVSVVTMHRAIATLRTQGTLITLRGHGTRMASHYHGEETPSPLQRRMQHWEHVANELSADITNGVYTPSVSFPSQKQLRMRFGISHRTLQKACNALVKRGYLVRFGKTFRVPQITPRDSSTDIILITLSSSSDFLGTHWERECYRALESLCRNCGIRLQHWMFVADKHNPAFVTKEGNTISKLPNLTTALGSIIFTRSYYSNDRGFISESLLKLCSPSSKPVALFDETGEEVFREFVSGRRMTRLFQMATSRSAAETVSEYLIRRKHRHIAYISPFHKTPWSNDRCDALTHFIASPINGGRIYPAVDTTKSYPWDYQHEVADHYFSLAEHLAHWTPRNLPSPFNTEESVTALQRSVQSVFREMPIRHTVRQLCKPILENSAITAWVAANDHTACCANEFLQEHKEQNSQKIALIGFDDSHEALLRDITSYNFNVAAIARAMLDFICNPRKVQPKVKDNILEVNGVLIERGSSR